MTDPLTRARRTGPIERELRRGRATERWFWGDRCSVYAFKFARGAARNLGLEGIGHAGELGLLPDVMSEAIEAAEALNV